MSHKALNVCPPLKGQYQKDSFEDEIGFKDLLFWGKIDPKTGKLSLICVLEEYGMPKVILMYTFYIYQTALGALS